MMTTRSRVRFALPAFALAVFALTVTEGHSKPACEDGYCGQISTGGLPTAAAWLDDDRMYLAYHDGKIRLLNVDSGERKVVLDGLHVPTGLTVLNGHLYVTDLGNICHVMVEGDPENVNVWHCTRREFWTWPDEKKVEYLRTAGARILSFRIDSTGDLSGQSVVEDRILTWERDHSANGLANDGEYVYVSIGYPFPWEEDDYFVKNAGELPGRGDLMGTIARFRPADKDPHVEVYARGFRNVYGISIAPYGTIYGADNDGDSGQKEELNAIVAGADYGYPSHGTNRAEPKHGVTEPLAVLPGDGSTVAYAARYGVYVAYTHHTGQAVVDWFDYETFTPERFFRAPGTAHITSILERYGLLYLVALGSGKIHVVEQGRGPVLSRMPIPEWARKWTMDGAVIRETYRAAVAGEPAARSTFDVYLDGGRLIYVKEPCQAADMSEGFFLQVFPSQRPSESDGRGGRLP